MQKSFFEYLEHYFLKRLLVAKSVLFFLFLFFNFTVFLMLYSNNVIPSGSSWLDAILIKCVWGRLRNMLRKRPEMRRGTQIYEQNSFAKDPQISVFKRLPESFRFHH